MQMLTFEILVPINYSSPVRRQHRNEWVGIFSSVGSNMSYFCDFVSFTNVQVTFLNVFAEDTLIEILLTSPF